MYIEPNTNIRLLNNVPLDNTYEHTIYFSSASAQSNYFISLTKYNLTNYTYQRVNKGKARVGIKADNIYDCNYMMFQNTSYGNKWFYAFITSVEFVNNECAEISFEIDVLQTWLFDFTLKQCFIERQHTVTDNPYEHYEPEPLDFGDMVQWGAYSGTIDWDDWVLVICTAPLNTGAGTAQLALLQNGMVSCAEYYTCLNTSESVNDFINNVLPDQSQDAVLSAYLFPNAFINAPQTGHLPDTYISAPRTVDSGVINAPSSIDGYTPKNKKLFCSPYMLYEVTDNCGDSQFYKPELFYTQDTRGVARFNITGVYVGIPQIVVYPLNYKGNNINYAEGYTITDFPMMGISSDTFRAWLAQNAGNIALNTAANLFSGVTSAASGNAGGVVSSVLGVAQTVNNYMVASNMPNRMVTRDSSGVMAALKQKKPVFKIKTITSMYARMIDDYFTKYGYAIGVLDTPNIHARPHWTYCKTNGCVLVGNMPQDDIRKVCQIFDKGVTWWVNGNEVGNYSLDNSPS